MLVTLLGIVTEVRPLQPEKAELPILVTLLGIETEVRPLQPEKAELPMLVTLLGIVTEVRPLQPENAEIPMFSTLSVIAIFSNEVFPLIIDVIVSQSKTALLILLQL